MKILTVHPVAAGAARLIPLFVLQKRYIERLQKFKNYFLVPARYHELLKNRNIDVLELDNSINKGELNKYLSQGGKQVNINDTLSKVKENISKAASNIEPSVIIEDFEPYTLAVCKEHNIARISIHRTGQFRSIPYALRNSNHMHSCEKSVFEKKVYDASIFLGVKNVSTKNKSEYSDYPRADAKIIPGIPSIEVLPHDIEDKDSYFYSGPLTVEDNPSDIITEQLLTFFEKYQHKKKVFITTGTVDKSSLVEYIQILLKRNYAVITTQKIQASSDDAIFFNHTFPLNFICQKIDLVIHQCGSGMYHYPILNEKPFITIGTQCYDREDIAQRLQLLGVGKHVPHPKDDKDYLLIFEKCIDAFENKTLTNFDQLIKLKEEIYETMLNFNIEKVIDYAISKKASNMTVS